MEPEMMGWDLAVEYRGLVDQPNECMLSIIHSFIQQIFTEHPFGTIPDTEDKKE